MKRLDELFEVRNGLASSQVDAQDEPDDVYRVMYVCPSKTQAGAISGWVNPDNVPLQHVYPGGTLHVSADGAGSHTYSYVSATEFVPTHHVRVLLPLQPMTDVLLRYYAYLITKNRPKFNYGRAPRGERLAKVMLPEPHELPAWLHEVDLDAVAREVDEFTHMGATGVLPEAKWARVKITDLFDIAKGKGPSLADALDSLGDTPFVTASDKNNGVSAWTGSDPTHEGGTLSLASNGSVGEVFYQRAPFCASGDVVVLTPRFSLDPDVALFLCTVLRFEGKSLFSYSRKWSQDRLRNSSVWVPMTEDGRLDLAYMARTTRGSLFSPAANYK